MQLTPLIAVHLGAALAATVLGPFHHFRRAAVRNALSTPLHDDDLDRLAHRRAGAKLGWWIHAGVYLAVNLLLAAISLHHGRGWFVYPAAGWGLGLLVHGLAVWIALPGGGLHARLLARERAVLERRG